MHQYLLKIFFIKKVKKKSINYKKGRLGNQHTCSFPEMFKIENKGLKRYF